jgi:hypothetical protein
LRLTDSLDFQAVERVERRGLGMLEEVRIGQQTTVRSGTMMNG